MSRAIVHRLRASREWVRVFRNRFFSIALIAFLLLQAGGFSPIAIAQNLPLSCISGIIVDANGQAVTHASVNLYVNGKLFPSPENPQFSRSGSGVPGAFVFYSIPQGNYELRVTAGTQSSSTPISLGAASVSLIISLPGYVANNSGHTPAADTVANGVAGFVLDVYGYPVPGADIVVRSGSQTFASGRSADDGFFSFAGLSPSQYDVAANASTARLASSGTTKVIVTDRTPATMVVLSNTVTITSSPTPAPEAAVDPTPVIASVVVGTSLGLLGLLVAKLNSTLQGLLKSVSVRYASLFEARYRQAVAGEKRVLLFGISAADLAVAVASVVIIGGAFWISGRKLDVPLLVFFMVASGVFTVVHELAHMIAAYHFRAQTELKFWGLGTAIMLVTSLLGNAFAQPSRTVINDMGGLEPRKTGLIVLAGPMASISLSALCLILLPLGGPVADLAVKAFPIGLLTAVYSLMPFHPMEGNRVYRWSRPVWAAIFIPLLGLYFALLLLVR